MPKIGRTLSYINTERKGKSTEQSSVTQSLGSSRPGGTVSMPQGDYLLKSIWDKVFEIRTDSQGTEYIFGKLPMVTQYGITMYSGDGVDIPSLASGLPFDGRTIWYNPDTQQIEVIGGTGGGSGEGVSNFWDLSGIPSWITNSKPKYSYSEIEGTPDLTKYALASQIPSLSGYATESWVLQKNYATKATTLSGYGITDAYTKTNVDDLLLAYVTLGGTQTITGEKNFTGGLKVNGSHIYYDTEKKYWKLEGDLLVTGGVTMYGNEGTFTPSTIMDALLYDDATLGINSNGQLYVKGGTSGGGLDITALQNYLTQNSYLNVTSGDNRYLKLSGGTLTLPNHVGLVIKRTNVNSPVIAFYNNDELEHNYIGFEGNRPIIMNKSGVASTIWHSGNFTPSNYLPLSGGTITGELSVSSTSNNRAKISLISAADVPNDLVFGTNGEYHWSITSRDSAEGRYIGLYNNKEGSNGWVFKANYDTRVLDFMNTPTVNGNTIWHSDNDGSGSGLDADLLDGKHLSEIIRYEGYSNKNANKADTPQTITYWAENGGYGSTYGTALNIQGAGSWNNRIAFRTDGKIDYYQGINTGDMSYIGQLAFTSSNVASATKLQTARTIWGQSFDGTGNVDGKILLTSWDNDGIGLRFHNNTKGAAYISMYAADGNAYVFGQNGNRFLINHNVYGDIFNILGGNVGIGTPNPSAKFQVNGNAAIYSSSAGVISLYRTVSDGGSYVDYYPLNQTSQKWRVGAGSVDEFFYEAADGSNLARICHHATKGTRLEVGKRFLSVQPSGSDADRSVITLISNGDSPTDFIMGSGNYAWSITSRNSAEGHLLGFYSALSGQYAMRVYKEGNVLVTGGITMYSDQRKKTILNHVELSLKDIADAPLIEHYYNSDDKKTTHVGSIAQYWALMNDWFCKLDNEGYYTMEIQNAALASAISIARELDRYETKTDKAIKTMKKRICELEEEVERLKAS